MSSEAPDRRTTRAEAGFAHVATLAFVAARTIPGFGYPVSLVGGTAIAHATDRLGGRRGLAAGFAAAIESVAILGPARMSGPGGQLTTAPLVGLMHRRGHGPLSQTLACASVRAFFNVLTTLLFIVVIAGGIDTYVGSYDATVGRIPGAPEGTEAALIATVIGIVIWSLGASAVQVLVFRRADRRWRRSGGIGSGPATAVAAGAVADAGEDRSAPGTAGGKITIRRRFDPRAVIASTVIAFVLLLLSTSPPLLAAVAIWLLVVWQLAPAEAEVWRPGLALAATIAAGAFLVNWIGGESAGDGLEHGARAALLVLAATWMRGAAGSDGIRNVARRLLGRLGGLRSAVELRAALDALSGDRRMGAAIRGLIADVRAVEGELRRMLDAAIDWVATEAGRFRSGEPPPSPALAYGPLDLIILVGAALPALVLAH